MYGRYLLLEIYTILYACGLFGPPLYLIPGSTTAKKQNQNSHTNRSTKTPKRSEERAPEGKEQSKLSKQHKRLGHHEPRSKGLYSHKIHRHEQIT